MLGKKVVFEIVDDRTDTALTKTLFEGVFRRKLPVVLGPSASGQATEGQNLAKAAGFPLISPSASTPVTTLGEPANERFFFRTAPSHALQAKAIAIRLFKGIPLGAAGDGGVNVATCRKLAIITQDDAYGNPIANGISETTKALGGQPPIVIKVPSAPAASYEAQVAELIAAKPDCQVIAGFPANGTVYMRSFKKGIASDTSRDWSTFISMGSNALKNSDALIQARENPADPTSKSAMDGM